MDLLKSALIKQERMLKDVIARASDSLNNAPPGHLRIHSGRSGKEYYHLSGNKKEDPGRSGKYIRKEDYSLAVSLAQKQYDERIMKAAVKQLQVVQFALDRYDESILREQYTNLSEDRRALVTPYFTEDEEYIKNWLAEEYTGNSFSDDVPDFRTKKGERVRSKSEIIIANKLVDMGIPYKYEKPLTLANGKTVYPDFNVLNIRLRKEYYFEYLGKMDDPAYVRRNMEKINLYEQCGIFPGEKLVLAYEIGNQINVWNLEALFRHYFL